MENCSKEYVAAYLTNIWVNNNSNCTYTTYDVIQEKFSYFYKVVNEECEKYGR